MRCILLFSIGALFLVSSCGSKAGAGVEVGSSFTGYVPSGTKALMGVKVDVLKTTEFYKRHENQFKVPQLSAFSERVGMDPIRDLTTIVLAWDGKQLLTMAQGNFKSDDVQQRVAKLTPEQEKYKDLVLFGSRQQAITFLPKGMAMAGASDEIKRSIDEAATGGGGVPDELQTRLHGVLPNAQVWAASYGILPLKNIPVASDTQSLLSNLVDYVNGTTLGIAFDAGAHLKLDISCTSAEGVQRVNDALRGLLGFARLNTPDNQMDMLHLWDAIQIEKKERDVEVHADLTGALADKLLTQIAGMSRLAR